MLASLHSIHRAPSTPTTRPPILLLHGIGLGAWIWERDQGRLADRGWSSWAVDLPGHGRDQGRPAGLSELADAATQAAEQLENPVVIGHSMGGLVAQIVASRVPVRALVLVSAVPPKPLHVLPTKSGLKQIAPQLARLVRGKPLDLSDQAYLESGFDQAPQGALQRRGPWPNRLVRDLVRARPEIRALDCPVLVTHGFRDPVVPLMQSRLLADHYDAVLWRFDDLAHHPMLEHGGTRHLDAVADWLDEPVGRRVREIDAFSPGEGVGGETRRERNPNPVRSDSRFGDRFRGKR